MKVQIEYRIRDPKGVKAKVIREADTVEGAVADLARLLAHGGYEMEEVQTRVLHGD